MISWDYNTQGGAGQYSAPIIETTASNVSSIATPFSLDQYVPQQPGSYLTGSVTANTVENQGPEQIAQGSVYAYDREDGENITWSTPRPWSTYGSHTIDPYTGAWTYTLNNESENLKQIGQGEVVGENILIRATDTDGNFSEKVIRIEVTGINQDPSISVIGQVQ